jgi:DNA-directed RNA polymerase alpha subunit
MSSTNNNTSHKHFYTFKELAYHFSNYGYTSDFVRDDLAAAIVNDDNERRYSRVMAAGLIAGLREIVEELRTLRYRVNAIEDRLRPPPPVPEKDAVADAYLRFLQGGMEAMEMLDLSGSGVRVRNAIGKANRQGECRTPSELARYGESRLLDLRNVGYSTVEEIREFLRDKYGLELAP